MDDFIWKCPLCNAIIRLWIDIEDTPGHYTTIFMERHMRDHESGMIPNDIIG